jgi:hypothetical protein
MQEKQKIEPQEETPVEPQREEAPAFAVGIVSVIVTE